jgi:hypothetical protein
MDSTPAATVRIDEISLRPGEVFTVWVTNQTGTRTQVEIRSITHPTRPASGHPQIFVDSTDQEPVAIRSFGRWRTLEYETRRYKEGRE